MEMEDSINDDLPEMMDLTTSNDVTFSTSNSVGMIPLAISVVPSSYSLPSPQIVPHPPVISSKTCVCRGNIQWTWDQHNKSDNVEILKDNEVRFNNKLSNGTAVVRCTEPMSNHQYYWEVKMNYPVYGTDVMIGVGTPEATVAYLPGRYVSRLGMDEQTWGFSHHGIFQHNGEKRDYSEKLQQGSVIGFHLDFWKGTLAFYKDRKYLGIACSGLKDRTLYAMASSTAACSGMRITHASCFPTSLQFLCAVKLRDLIPDDKDVLDIIDVPCNLKLFLHNNLGWLLSKTDLGKDFKNCCMPCKNNFGLEVNENKDMVLCFSSMLHNPDDILPRNLHTIRENPIRRIRDNSERNTKRFRTSD